MDRDSSALQPVSIPLVPMTSAAALQLMDSALLCRLICPLSLSLSSLSFLSLTTRFDAISPLQRSASISFFISLCLYLSLSLAPFLCSVFFLFSSSPGPKNPESPVSPLFLPYLFCTARIENGRK